MGDHSTIEWTEATWNPVTGCTRVSPGCDHCYAARMSFRLENMGRRSYEGLTSRNAKGDRHFNGKINLVEHALELPLRWKKPRVIFVNSMSDLFHKNMPTEYIRRVFEVMNRAGQHTFQILTKRSARLLELSPELDWADHIWMGVSVENESVTSRISDLRATQARIKWLSLEPLLGPLSNLDLTGIDWAVVGGESGPGARVMEADWVREIRDRCLTCSVPFFFKQWGGVNKKKAGRELDGRTWDQYPVERDALASKENKNNDSD